MTKVAKSFNNTSIPMNNPLSQLDDANVMSYDMKTS